MINLRKSKHRLRTFASRLRDAATDAAGHPPPAQPLPDDPKQRLFRGGFVLCRHVNRLAILPGWQSIPLPHGYRLFLHPQCTVARAENVQNGTSILIVGRAFDPEHGIFDEQALAEALLAAPDENARLDALDRISGRFVCIMAGSDGLQIYNDAMGSRTIFYCDDFDVVASHIEIISILKTYRMSDMFFAFTQSKNYMRRDVKYLPGLITPYDGIRYLTPNTRLTVPGGKIERYWPRKPLGHQPVFADARQALEVHLKGLADYFSAKGLRPVLGLTGGTDSRGILAALHRLDPYAFTFVRSEQGDRTKNPDSAAATALAHALNVEHDVLPIRSSPKLRDVENELSRAYRISTSYYRGTDSSWLHPVDKKLDHHDNVVFVRGFGGEICRGFYQGSRTYSGVFDEQELANLYDVNSGADYTRRKFRQFMKVTNFTPESLMGRELCDMFYWEHRMGVWGSVAMSEADLVVPSIVGYNSRNLYDAFFAQPMAERAERKAFVDLIAEWVPDIADVAYC